MRLLAVFVTAAAVVVTAAACGSAPSPGGAPSNPAPAKVNLTFRIIRPGGQPPVHGTLRCEPAGGTVPDAAAACRVLLRMKHSPFAPVPRRTICPMIMMSDSRITLTGTWFGTPVHRVVTDGGCDIILFATLARILR